MTCCDDGYIVKSDGDVIFMWLLVADVFLEVLIHRRTTRFLTVVKIYDSAMFVSVVRIYF